MLGHLNTFLPPSGSGLPSPSVTTVRVDVRSLGVGNRRGNERIGEFAILALKGGRIDATVRFQIWAADAAAADSLLANLQSSIISGQNTLWGLGFLKLSQAATSMAEEVPGSGGWRKTTDFKVLYEYRFKDLDGAESIIARIPIHADPEEKFSPFRETTTVQDAIVRWDDRGVEEWVPTSGVSRAFQVTGLAILAYLPTGWTGSPVTVTRLQDGNPAPPTLYPDWPTFLNAVSNTEDPDLHARIILPSVADLLTIFTPSGDTFPLGDWDEDGIRDEYVPGALAFGHPIRFNGGDQLRFSYPEPQFDAPAVVYLRAAIQGG
jgi:hypothetical protein